MDSRPRVVREYAPEPERCLRALDLLLRRPAKTGHGAKIAHAPEQRRQALTRR